MEIEEAEIRQKRKFKIQENDKEENPLDDYKIVNYIYFYVGILEIHL